jgi:hypothetical protein
MQKRKTRRRLTNVQDAVDPADPPEQIKELTETQFGDALDWVIAHRARSHVLLLLLQVEDTLLNGIFNNEPRNEDIFRLSGTVRPYD